MKTFFDTVRPHFPRGRLTQGQIDGMNAIIAGAALYGDGNINTLAYQLATAKLETAHTMQPIHERGARAYFNKYEPGTKLGRALGNTVKGDGYRFRGRGLVQITGRANYKKAGDILGIDLLADPDKALDPDIAVRILLVGTQEGWFTGKALSDFIDDLDEGDDEDLREYVAARAVVNGKDKATEIGKSALIFEAALRSVDKLAVKAEPPAEAAGAAAERPFPWGIMLLVFGAIAAFLWFF